MFAAWRFKLKEAETALQQGRLEDAAAILQQGDLLSYLPIKQLLAHVAIAASKRSVERARRGEFDAAWQDLDLAKQWSGETTHYLAAQRAVVDASLSEVVRYLAAEDAAGAQQRIDALARKQVKGVSLDSLREVARRLQSATKLRERGQFVEAIEQLQAATTLRPDLPPLEDLLKKTRDAAEQARLVQEQLHVSLAAADWTHTLALSEQLLQISPQCRLARNARRQAWAEVGGKLGDSRVMRETQPWASTLLGGVEDCDIKFSRGPRFLLWVDAVGGYLVCLADEVVIGQAHPGNQVDVPIQADIRRRHVSIKRQGEGYVLDPLAAKETTRDNHVSAMAARQARVRIDGKDIRTPALLNDGDEIELGEGVKLRFRKPHALSASARLEILSNHRTHPFADAVLLMAESAVLGPKWQNHVICRDWQGDVVLYRQEESLFCRAMQSLEIDGQLQEGRGRLNVRSRIVGPDFSLSLEPVEIV
ncbi:FHA domain-containing protein [Anatilimnocola sp. NA78]|uniref:FHA domain-containing protein n=1 Tax=Anatilimnocola sp. NA78 TaxID=3415683 RepID=UPI003CE505BB